MNERTGREHVIADGGMLSNFPVWLFDCEDSRPPAYPTFGLLLVEPDPKAPIGERLPAPDDARRGAGDFVRYAKAMADVIMEAHDRLYVADADFARTIPIPGARRRDDRVRPHVRAQDGALPVGSRGGRAVPRQLELSGVRGGVPNRRATGPSARPAGADPTRGRGRARGWGLAAANVRVSRLESGPAARRSLRKSATRRSLWRSLSRSRTARRCGVTSLPVPIRGVLGESALPSVFSGSTGYRQRAVERASSSMGKARDSLREASSDVKSSAREGAWVPNPPRADGRGRVPVHSRRAHRCARASGEHESA
jgi:hypothetical protein